MDITGRSDVDLMSGGTSRAPKPAWGHRFLPVTSIIVDVVGFFGGRRGRLIHVPYPAADSGNDAKQHRQSVKREKKNSW